MAKASLSNGFESFTPSIGNEAVRPRSAFRLNAKSCVNLCSRSLQGQICCGAAARSQSNEAAFDPELVRF